MASALSAHEGDMLKLLIFVDEYISAICFKDYKAPPSVIDLPIENVRDISWDYVMGSSKRESKRIRLSMHVVKLLLREKDNPSIFIDGEGLHATSITFELQVDPRQADDEPGLAKMIRGSTLYCGSGGSRSISLTEGVAALDSLAQESSEVSNLSSPLAKKVDRNRNENFRLSRRLAANCKVNQENEDLLVTLSVPPEIRQAGKVSQIHPEILSTRALTERLTKAHQNASSSSPVNRVVPEGVAQSCRAACVETEAKALTPTLGTIINSNSRTSSLSDLSRDIFEVPSSPACGSTDTTSKETRQISISKKSDVDLNRRPQQETNPVFHEEKAAIDILDEGRHGPVTPMPSSASRKILPQRIARTRAKNKINELSCPKTEHLYRGGVSARERRSKRTEGQDSAVLYDVQKATSPMQVMRVARCGFSSTQATHPNSKAHNRKNTKQQTRVDETAKRDASYARRMLPIAMCKVEFTSAAATKDTTESTLGDLPSRGSSALQPIEVSSHVSESILGPDGSPHQEANAKLKQSTTEHQPIDITRSKEKVVAIAGLTETKQAHPISTKTSRSRVEHQHTPVQECIPHSTKLQPMTEVEVLDLCNNGHRETRALSSDFVSNKLFSKAPVNLDREDKIASSQPTPEALGNTRYSGHLNERPDVHYTVQEPDFPEEIIYRSRTDSPVTPSAPRRSALRSTQNPAAEWRLRYQAHASTTTKPSEQGPPRDRPDKRKFDEYKSRADDENQCTRLNDQGLAHITVEKESDPTPESQTLDSQSPPEDNSPDTGELHTVSRALAAINRNVLSNLAQRDMNVSNLVQSFSRVGKSVVEDIQHDNEARNMIEQIRTNWNRCSEALLEQRSLKRCNSQSNAASWLKAREMSIEMFRAVCCSTFDMTLDEASHEKA